MFLFSFCYFWESLIHFRRSHWFLWLGKIGRGRTGCARIGYGRFSNGDVFFFGLNLSLSVGPSDSGVGFDIRD